MLCPTIDMEDTIGVHTDLRMVVVKALIAAIALDIGQGIPEAVRHA